jgi:hypothetical protein
VRVVSAICWLFCPAYPGTRVAGLECPIRVVYPPSAAILPPGCSRANLSSRNGRTHSVNDAQSRKKPISQPPPPSLSSASSRIVRKARQPRLRSARYRPSVPFDEDKFGVPPLGNILSTDLARVVFAIAWPSGSAPPASGCDRAIPAPSSRSSSLVAIGPLRSGTARC